MLRGFSLNSGFTYKSKTRASLTAAFLFYVIIFHLLTFDKEKNIKEINKAKKASRANKAIRDKEAAAAASEPKQ